MLPSLKLADPIGASAHGISVAVEKVNFAGIALGQLKQH